jgi:hypothetical protein
VRDHTRAMLSRWDPLAFQAGIEPRPEALRLSNHRRGRRAEGEDERRDLDDVRVRGRRPGGRGDPRVERYRNRSRERWEEERGCLGCDGRRKCLRGWPGARRWTRTTSRPGMTPSGAAGEAEGRAAAG